MTLPEKAKKIKLVATDIDGVWTNGVMYYTENGDFMKAFSTYDGMAVKLLRNAGIPVIIMTGEQSEIVSKRASKLGIERVYLGENEKLKRLKYVCADLELNLDEIAFIGDDVNDSEVIEAVGLSAMPSSSPVLDKHSPDIITQRKGGEGAFREFADLILSNQPKK